MRYNKGEKKDFFTFIPQQHQLYEIVYISKDFLPPNSIVNELFEENSLPVIKIFPSISENRNSLISMIEKEEDIHNRITSHLFCSILEYILKFKRGM